MRPCMHARTRRGPARARARCMLLPAARRASRLAGTSCVSDLLRCRRHEPSCAQQERLRNGHCRRNSSPTTPSNAMQIFFRHPRKGARAPGAASVVLLLFAAGCVSSRAAPYNADLSADPTHVDGWLVPECQAAAASWLRHVAATGHAQDRVAARQLLGSGLLPQPRTQNSSSPTLAQDHGRGNFGGNLDSEDLFNENATVLKHRQMPALEAGKDGHVMDKRLQALAAHSDVENDGPALRAALVPAVGMEGQWNQVLKWPSNEFANPCTGSSWTGIDCSTGRIQKIALSQKSLPPYYIKSAISNLTGLSTM